MADQSPKVFVCCQPCREHRCGFECKHAELDGLEFKENLLVTPAMHPGCMCVWAEKVSGAGPNPRLVTG